MISHDDLKVLLASPDVPKFTGNDAVFMPIDEKWGIKFFYSDAERDRNYEKQYEAYKLGIGPIVGPKMSFVFQGEQQHGFITERCKCCSDAIAEYAGSAEYTDCANSDYFDTFLLYEDDFLNDNQLWGTAQDDLHRKCRKVSYRFYDDHPGNWGLNQQGEPVIIDFSREPR